MNRPVRIAVIGCGGIANGAHLPAYAENKDCKIAAVVDIVEERARAAREKYGAEVCFTDYKELLKWNLFDAVSICTPNVLHDAMAIDCLKAGKDVLCEKPAAMRSELVAEMQKNAHETGRILNIGVCMRFNDAVNEIKKLIDSGRLGKVYHVNCSFRAFRCIPGLGGWFTDKAQSGGGVLIDWGIHFLDLILYSAGIRQPRSVSASAYNILGKNPDEYIFTDMWGAAVQEKKPKTAEEFVTGFIRTEGPSITFTGAWAQNIGIDEKLIDFCGEKAGIRSHYCGDFELYNTQDGVLYTCKPSFTQRSMYKTEIDEFVAACGSKARGRNYIDEIMPSVTLLDAIYRSAEEKREIIL